MSNADILVVSGAELAVLAMDRGRWAEAAERVNSALATIDEHRMDDNALSVLAFAAAARLAVHRGDLKQANARLTQAMRARPSCNSAMPYLGVRSRLQLAKVYSVTGDHATVRHLLREIDDIVLRRPALGALIDAVSELRRIATSSPQAGAAGALPLTAAELRLLPYLQTHFTSREIAERLFVSAQHRQHPDQLDLSEARRLLAQRRRATSDDDWSPRRIAGTHPPDENSKTSSVSHPSANASLGAAATTHGKPDDANNTDQDVDDLRDRGAGAHCSVGLRAVRGHGATDRDQRRKTDERQRLRIKLPASDIGAVRVVLRPAFVVDREAAQPFCVVHSTHRPDTLA